MKHLVSALAVASMAISPGAFSADVGVSISVGQPGFFGRIELGDAPSPRFINRTPVVGIPVPGEAFQPPIYLHVRPGYERNWRRHCREYGACGQPVYFVRDDWYNDAYVPHYREHHRDERRDHRDDGRDRRDEGRDHRDEGRGHHDEGRNNDH